MKRLFALLLIAALVLPCISFGAFAVSEENQQQVTYYSDGSYLTEVVMVSGTKSSGTVTGAKIKTYYNANDVVQWEATLKGTFTYNGTSATCTAASCDVSISNNNCYVVSKNVSKSGNTANCDLVMGYKVLGITIRKDSYKMVLTCDKDGNLS